MSSHVIDHAPAHASDHDHHDDHANAIHPGPTNFFYKYVYSIDHKVIAVQFTFATLFFVFIGGGLALAVRYQLAWPQQNVPFHMLLPNKMTATAPEANLALWDEGATVIFKADANIDGHTIPAGATATLTGFPKGLAVTLPAGTVVTDVATGSEQTLEKPLNATVPQRAWSWVTITTPARTPAPTAAPWSPFPLPPAAKLKPLSSMPAPSTTPPGPTSISSAPSPTQAPSFSPFAPLTPWFHWTCPPRL